MKFAFVLLIVLSQHSCYLSKKSFISDAISDFVKEYYVKKSIKFYFVIDSKSAALVKIIDDTLKQMKESETYQVFQGFKRKVSLDQSAIWIFDDVERFWKSRGNFPVSEEITVKFRNLIYCRKGSSMEIEERINAAERNHQKEDEEAYRGSSLPHLWSFLIEENGKISLKSFTMFSSQLCGSLQAIKINEFSKKIRTWSSMDFFAADTFNFHGCELVFSLFYFKDHYYDQDLITIIEALAKNLNYTVEYNAYMHHLKRLNNSKPIDVFIAMTTIGKKSEKFVIATFETASYGLTVPFGEPYSPLEKLFLPFEFEVWILFGLLFLIAFFVVFFIHHYSSSEVRHFITGKNVTAPSLNIFLIFMGGGMTILPKRNFARYILMCFILFCLVMRTAYQGKYFDALTGDVRKKEVQTVDEVIAKGLTIYIQETQTVIKNFEMFKGAKVVPVYYQSLHRQILPKVDDPSIRASALVADLDVISSKIRSEGKYRLKLLNQKVFIRHRGVLFPYHHFLYPSYNKNILDLIGGGFFEKWNSKLTKHRYNVEKPPKPQPIVLNMNRLGIGFLVWILALVVSSVAFLSEMAYYWIPKAWRSKIFESVFQSYVKNSKRIH